MVRSVNILLAAVALVASVNGQLTTTIDDNSGLTLVESISTNRAGDPVGTVILSTVSQGRLATTAATALTTALTTAPTTTLAVQGTAPCTTCPRPPTLYTVSGVVMTFTPTTPVTSAPVIPSSGTVVAASQFSNSLASGASSFDATASHPASGAAAPGAIVDIKGALVDKIWMVGIVGAAMVAGGLALA